MAKIELLSPSVARKIAAGEVIERPASVLRELLDNAIDSGATEIEVHLLEGGLKEIRVTDNGCGMSPADLENSILPHATSKISKAEDLYKLSTLGFRGEALSSIAACSRLQITSKEENLAGHKIVCEDGKIIESIAFAAPDGTSIRVADLFYSIPGRKKFMKSAQGEATACLNIFYDKSAAFAHITFRYFVDGKLKHFLPASSLLERIQFLYKSRLDTQFLRFITSENESNSPISLSLVTTTPSVYRHDKKNIQIFINSRRIQEFALQQAIEYGYSEILPGGCYPTTFAFIQIDPALVDFNIHPAKREVKIQDISIVRNIIVKTIKNFLSPQMRTMQPVTQILAKNVEFDFPTSTPTKPETSQTIQTIEIPPSPAYSNPLAEFVNKSKNEFTASPTPSFTSLPIEKPTTPTTPISTSPSSTTEEINYLGSFQNLFLIATKGNQIFMIDQHAAHERILFNQYCNVTSIETLLLPIALEESVRFDAGLFSFTKIKNLKSLGIELKFSKDSGWEIFTLPASVKKFGSALVELLPNLPEDLFELEKKLFATLACREAIKEGDFVPSSYATELIKLTLELDKPHCPHGRPIYFVLSMEELFQLVGRTF